jgi:hypothetical protein
VRSGFSHTQAEGTQGITEPIFFYHIVSTQDSVMQSQPSEELAFRLCQGFPYVYGWEFFRGN